MVLQTMVPLTSFAKEITPEKNNLVKVGSIDVKSYPQLNAKTVQEANRRKKQELQGRKMERGARLFRAPYFPSPGPDDNQKPLIFANVNAIFTTRGLDGGKFDWEGVFGKDSDGKLNKAQIVFEQMDDKTSTRTGVKFFLKVDKDGKYTWSDSEGKPTKLPLYSTDLKPYRYEVLLDEDVTEHVKLLTSRFIGTEGGYSFGKPDPVTREIVGNINLDLSLQQIASTKFTSKWDTGVVEAERPRVEGSYLTGYEADPEDYGIFKFPSNDTDKTIIRNDALDPQNPGEYSEYIASQLDKTPKVGVADPDPDATDTYTLDRDKKKISYKGKTYKYEVEYDVINGGKLTMTEVIPVTFDANGGKFANFTAPDTATSIVKEVDYDGTLADKAETPKKPGKAFKGWATDKDGKIPATDDDYKNLKAAKTFYAIWSDEDIQADELKVAESLGRFPKKGEPKFTNDFVPTFEDLKAKVKVKNSDGDFGPLPTTGVTFSIVDGTKEYTENSNDLKKFIYEKVKENNKDEVSRTEKVKAKITYDDGTTREVEIPITVLKNIYKGSDQGNKLPYIPNDYVKVKINPTDKAQNPDKTYYYVNPKAKVIVTGKDPVGAGDNKFSKWTIKADSDSGAGTDYTFGKRQIYGEDSTITAQYGTGIVKIAYVDQDGNKIYDKYKIAGQDYPSEKSGGLGTLAVGSDFANEGPNFKGYVFGSRDSIKGSYKDPKDSDVSTITYKYYKKVTTTKPKYGNSYFKVVFNANGGEFKTDPKNAKDVYVYFDGNDKTVKKVTFDEVREEIENTYGLPTKKMAEFKEWQDKKDKGTKVGDSKEIQFPGWVDGDYTPEVFYAHYGDASAKIKYIDLDGKPIADVYKLDDQKYPTEKTGEPGNKIESDVYTAETAPKFTGYKFNRIELNPANGKYSLDKNTTIKIYYEKVPDVIPANSDGSNPDSVPDDYVRVEFVPTDKGSIDGDKFFFVNPKKEVTIPVNNPTAKATYKFKEWKMGEDAKGEKYTPSTPKKFAQETVITATYEETENIIPYDPSATDPMVRPDGYVRVTFAAEPGLKLTESKAYYVKKNAKLKLSEIKSYETKYGYPKYKEETGYKFDKWDKPDTTEIEATDILVTAKATKLGTVIPEKNTDGSKNDKPKGYKEVTFVIKTGDEAKGSITGVAKFYVNPTEYVTINPPATKAETGYEFGAWDKDATRPTVYKEDATITGSFNGLKDVIPKTKDNDSEKPKGYVTVTFEIEKLDGKEAGKIVDGETITYFVKPNTDVTVPQPKTLANTGYKFKEWNLDTSKNAQYSKETKVKGSFTKLDDIIPATDPNTNKPNAKPEGYVAVTFDKGANGKSIEGQTVYYVNPEANPVKTLGDITKPTIKANTGYKFKDWNYVDAKAIQSNITVTAQYEEITDVVPKDNPKGGKNDKPEGYITVTFSTETNGKIKDTADVKTKVLYVNPNKASVLTPYAPKVTPNTGFDFAGWDTQIERAIKYNNNDVIKAKYNVKGDVIPQEKQDGSDKPAGYLTVTFVKGDHGELAGKKVYYVKPNKEVTVPAPTVKANVGYEFEKWDKALTQTFAEDTKITAGYKALDNIIPQEKTDSSDKPNGYVTVTFKSDANGSLTGKTVYYVKPNVDIDLTNTAKAINKNPNTGYTAEGGTWNPAIAKQKYTADAEYKFNFKALQDVIEKIDENTKKPEGYITVKLIPTDKATDKTEKVYFVNPLKDVTITNKPVGTEFTDANGITYKYTFTSWTVTSGTINSWNSGSINGQFTQDTEITAKYSTKVDYGKLVPAPVAKKKVVTPKGDTTKPEDLIENKTGLPEGTTFNYTNDGTPNVNNPGKPTAKVEVKYPNGKTVVVEVPITVVDNVVPQTGKDKPLVPKTYVKVVVDTTEKATANTKFEKTFWVKPNVEVTIPDILAPTGKQEKIGEVTKTNKFVKWKLEGSKPEKFYETKITDTFKDKESKIVATYEYGKNVEPKGKNNQWIPQGSNPSPKDFIENPYNDDDPNSKDNLPPGTKIEFVPGKEPDTEEPGTDKETTIKITYPNGETKEVPVKYNVTGDVVEQKDKDKKPEVPDNFVKVIVKTTDKATDETKFERTFWVKPTKEVTIPITEPTGKENQKVTIDGLGEKDVNYIFKEWQKVQTGEADDKLTEVKPAAKIDLAKNKYTDKVTVIEAVYKKSIVPGELVPAPVAKKNVLTPKGDTPKPEDLIENIPGSEKDPLPNGTKITYEEEPKIDNPGDSKAKVKIEYPNGKTVVVEVPIKVVDNVVPQTGKDKPLVPEGYVKVVVDTTEKATANTKFEKTFWVKPNVEVTIPDILAPTGKQEKIGEVTKTNKFVKWKLEGSKPEKFFETKITDTFKDKESKIVATYEFGKNVEPKGKNNQWIPQGSNPSPKDFIENPYNDDDPNNKDNLPPGTKIEFAEGKQPDTNTPGTDKETTIKITYPNGETKEVPVKYNVTGDVVEQKEGEDKPKVPDNFVKVIVKTTDKATDDTKFEKTFWVKPNKEVTIPVNNPEGKSEDKKKYEFDSWTWENVDTKDKIKGTFTKDTVIVAQYKTTTKAKYIEQIPEVVSEIPIVSLNQSDIDKDWFKIKNKNDTDSKIKIVEITEKPATDSLGIQSGKAKVTFKNGSSRIITIKLKVVDDVIESKGDKKTNDVPDNYKLVILDSTSDALEQTKRYFWINPNKDITLKAFKPQGKAGKVFDKWERSLSINWNKEGITENVLTIKAIYKDETTPDQPGGQPGEVEKHGHRYIERVAGKDRVHTAINTSRRFFNKSRYVIIADSGNYPDTLTATVLAHVLDAPILLNNTRYLEDDVAREIVRLGASEVIIVGGHKSISENVKSQLARYDQNSVQRIWGRDRYVTSSELAYEIQRLTGKVNKAIIASGENFPDALATAPLGSKEIAPILLVRRNQIDKKVDKALKDLNIMRVYVAGGPNSVSKKLEGQLPQVIRRFNGRDRYETAVLVASYTYPESKEVFVASGEVFPDALVIGPVCARRKAPILLSRTTPVKVTDDYIEKSNIEYLYIIGGTNTIYAETAHKYAIED